MQAAMMKVANPGKTFAFHDHALKPQRKTWQIGERQKLRRRSW